MRYGDKGWKLAEYEGSGSYQTLIVNVYGQTRYTSSTAGSNADSGIQHNPLSFLRGGYYEYSNGRLYNGGSNGYYWESKDHNSSGVRGLVFASGRLDPQFTWASGIAFLYKGSGFSIRCVVR